jgi:hypothetical protein
VESCVSKFMQLRFRRLDNGQAVFYAYGPWHGYGVRDPESERRLQSFLRQCLCFSLASVIGTSVLTRLLRLGIDEWAAVCLCGGNLEYFSYRSIVRQLTSHLVRSPNDLSMRLYAQGCDERQLWFTVLSGPVFSAFGGLEFLRAQILAGILIFVVFSLASIMAGVLLYTRHRERRTSVGAGG